MHYNGANNYLFANGKEIIKFETKDSEIVATPLFLGNTPKYILVDKMTKTELYGYVYNFRVDYRAIAVDDILHNYKCLMKKNNIV